MKFQKHAASLLKVGMLGLVFLALSGGKMRAQTPGQDISPKPVLDVMQQVAGWQLAHPLTNQPTGWIGAVGDAGMMALAGISGDPKYREAMVSLGETNHWGLLLFHGRQYHADDQCMGQTYTELYNIYRDNRMIEPLKQRCDYILAHPSETPSLDFSQGTKALELLSWCDSLFMAPPTWVRLYAMTHDERYLDFAVTNFWRTTDFLYDKDEHLYYRDSSFFKKREANGQKIFWSRGNGWVLAGIVRILQYLPMNHPDRARFEQLYKDMAAKILSCQQADGMWRASLLDPESYPSKETSGTGLYTYALAWGVNQGLLDSAQYKPAVEKAWAALVSCVEPDGKLTYVQPVGSDPKKFAASSTQAFGVGAFLLAGSEIYRMAVLEKTATAAPGVGFDGRVVITVANPSTFARESETVEIAADSYLAHAPTLAVMDGMSSRILDSQVYEEPNVGKKLLFQVDLNPGETRTYYLLNASALAATPEPIIKTLARFVPERYDDFAWESDRIAHRAYGLALIKAENTISSAPDVWIKKNHGLIVDTMYATKHYHFDNGEFMDDYRVGHSRGCGGVGIWDGKKLYTSSNYRNWKVITTGPIRSEFELTYDAWETGNGRMVSEVKRYSIDAGSWFTKAESIFTSDDTSPLTIGIGLAERACGTNGTELVAQDQTEGWMTYWQPEDHPKGNIGVAIVLPKGSVEAFTNNAPDMPDSKVHAEVPQPTHEGAPPIRDLLAITQAQVGKPLKYYFGACWNRSGDFTNDVQWSDYVKQFAERRDQPLTVTVGN